MDKVHIKSVEPLKEGSSRFVVPHRMIYEQNGVEKVWDLVDSHDSVGAIIYNATSNKLVFVSQFRPPVYRRAQLAKPNQNVGGDEGIVLEICMGIVDNKSLSTEETIKKEILEETGFSVSNVEKIGSWVNSVGLLGNTTTLFYSRVTEKDRVSKGGGRSDEGEMIDVVEISLSEVKDYIESAKVTPVRTTTILLFGYYWFMANKYSLEMPQ
uniref:Nudix hydrolase domain-containing protein n=1 Tax=Lepeophtheirus salmonis TaxID=72036 RepID=A0A0K2UB50_LEPSM